MVSFSLWGTFSKRYDTLLISPPETDISFRGGLNSELFNELFYLWQLRFSRVMQRYQDSVSYSDMCKANSLCRGQHVVNRFWPKSPDLVPSGTPCAQRSVHLTPYETPFPPRVVELINTPRASQSLIIDCFCCRLYQISWLLFSEGC